MAQPLILGDQIDKVSLQQYNGTYGWNDIVGTMIAGMTSGATDPTWTTFRNGVSAWRFASGAMNEVWHTFHIPHVYAPGTDIFPHVHWASPGTNAGVVRWGFEYTYAHGYNRGTFPATSTIYIEQAATGVAYRHMIAEVSTGILGGTIEPDGIIMARVFRDGAHANDTCTDNVFGLTVDLHFQTAALSTPNRNYPFS